MQKTNHIDFRIGKVIKRKGDKLYVIWKDHDDSFDSWIDKKDLVILFSWTIYPSKSKINVELDLSNYATESDFKNATVVDASKLAKVVDLANLK